MPDPEDELVARAKVLAEATGRDFEDVIADLADDGLLNNSNKENDADLITQLKEAAELMSAVQEINKEVSENTVLNGGDNKTEVEVNTTLEGDVVDRAIASVNRKVVELKKIALVIAPVFLLLSGGSLEALGVINMFGADDDDEYDDYDPIMIEYWGCTDWEAMNFDEYANMDDGSCEYHVYGCTNDAAPNYDDMATMDDGSCEPEYQPIRGCMDSEAENYDPEAEEDDGSCYYPPDPIKGCTDPEADNYQTEAEEDDGSCEYPPEPVEGCTDDEAENYNPDADTDDGSCEYAPEPSLEDCSVSIENHYRGHLNNNPSSDVMIVGFKVVPTDCDGFTIDVSIQLFEQGEPPAYTKHFLLAGDTDHDVSHTFGDMPEGTWTPKIRAVVEGQEKWEMNFWALDIEDQNPPCEGEASFYNSSYSIDYNNTNNSSLANLTMFWDADWSCEEIRYVEIDIYIVFNNTTIAYETRAFNLNGQSPAVANQTFTDLEVAREYEVFLIIWVERDGWEQDDTESITITIS